VLSIGAKINDLEGHYAVRFKTHASFGAYHENGMKIDPYYQRQGCSSMTVFSDSIYNTQGNVVTRFRCVGIFNDCFITNFLDSVLMREF